MEVSVISFLEYRLDLLVTRYGFTPYTRQTIMATIRKTNERNFLDINCMWKSVIHFRITLFHQTFHIILCMSRNKKGRFEIGDHTCHTSQRFSDTKQPELGPAPRVSHTDMLQPKLTYRSVAIGAYESPTIHHYDLMKCFRFVTVSFQRQGIGFIENVPGYLGCILWRLLTNTCICGDAVRTLWIKMITFNDFAPFIYHLPLLLGSHVLILTLRNDSVTASAEHIAAFFKCSYYTAVLSPLATPLLTSVPSTPHVIFTRQNQHQEWDFCAGGLPCLALKLKAQSRRKWWSFMILRRRY
jgi:hypothetical protein